MLSKVLFSRRVIIVRQTLDQSLPLQPLQSILYTLLRIPNDLLTLLPPFIIDLLLPLDLVLQFLNLLVSISKLLDPFAHLAELKEELAIHDVLSLPL